MRKLFSVAFGLCMLQSLAQIPTSGLVGRWEFSGNANDQSGNANHGIVFGASLVPDRCGNPNSAYHFNGSSDYIMMLQSGPTGSSSRSLSFWAKTTYTAFGNGSLAQCPFTYGTSTYGGVFQVQFNYNCQGVGLDVYNEELIRGNNCFADGAWHHFAVVYDGNGSQQFNSVNFYVDGILLPQISCYQTGTTQMINTGTGPIIIGTEGSFPNSFRWFDGSLDDYYLYNRVLTQAEIQQLYHACTPAISVTNPVCAGISTVYTISPVPGASSYTWTLPSGWSGSSTTNTILTVPGLNTGVISVSAINSCMGSVTRSATVTPAICEGVERREASRLELRISPNPVHERISITGNFEPGIIHVSIYDMQGSHVYTQDFRSTEPVQYDLSELKSGIYILEVQQAQQKSLLKLIKN